MKRALATVCLVGIMFLPAASPGQSREDWIAQGRESLRRAVDTAPRTGAARNIILFVGDGMSVTTVTAARIFDGQSRGNPGEENLLAFERFPYTALAKTYNTDLQVAESAGTMTAMITGVKTQSRFISVDQHARLADCASAKGRSLRTLLEEFELDGRATGIVTNARVTHATPAATYAHTPERGWEADADLPAPARDQGCRDIALQLLEFPFGDGIDVVLGGGRRNFLPRRDRDPEYSDWNGVRRDGRNLVREWLARNPAGTYAWNLDQFRRIDPERAPRVLGLFEPSHMQFETDRRGEPSLVQMTSLAIRILRGNPRGFFLMVEGGRIDHAHHFGNAYRALVETQIFAAAVDEADRLTDDADTLIIVTADHSHVMVMGGYPVRGNPILGKVVETDDHGQPAQAQAPALAADNLPYTTLGYYNGPGFQVFDGAPQRRRIHRGRADLSRVDTTGPDFYQESLVPLEWESHGGEDVPVYATGPWAHLIRGVQEQSYLYYVMKHAMQPGN